MKTPRFPFAPQSFQAVGRSAFLCASRQGIGAAMAGASLALLSGCAGLQQAPLVYSSQTTVGVDIGGTTAANPGITLTLGVKQTDVAYVPVAVAARPSKAKSDPSGGGTPLPGAEPGVQVVAAEFGQDESGGDQQQIRQAVESKRQSLNAAEKREAEAVASEGDLLRAKDAALAQRQRVQTAQGTLAQVPAAPPPAPVAAPGGPIANPVQPDLAMARLSANRESALNKLREQLIDIPLPDGLAKVPDSGDPSVLKAALDKALTSAQQDVTRAEAAYEAAKVARAEAAQQRSAARTAFDRVESLLVTKKRDAMSVYGSFNGLTTVDAGTTSRAGVNLGKVFSTGLAAQNLSEAEKVKAQFGCVGQMMAALGVSPTAAQAANATHVELLRLASAACVPGNKP